MQSTEELIKVAAVDSDTYQALKDEMKSLHAKTMIGVKYISNVINTYLDIKTEYVDIDRHLIEHVANGSCRTYTIRRNRQLCLAISQHSTGVSTMISRCRTQYIFNQIINIYNEYVRDVLNKLIGLAIHNNLQTKGISVPLDDCEMMWIERTPCMVSSPKDIPIIHEMVILLEQLKSPALAMNYFQVSEHKFPPVNFFKNRFMIPINLSRKYVLERICLKASYLVDPIVRQSYDFYIVSDGEYWQLDIVNSKIQTSSRNWEKRPDIPISDHTKTFNIGIHDTLDMVFTDFYNKQLINSVAVPENINVLRDGSRSSAIEDLNSN